MKINAIKRLTALVLSALFINLSFTACTSDNKAENKAENTTATEVNESKDISKQDDFYTAINGEWLATAQYSEETGYINFTTECKNNIDRFFYDYIADLPNADLSDDEKKLLILYEQFTEGQLEASKEIAGEYVKSISNAKSLKDIEKLYADKKLSLYNSLFDFELTNTQNSYALVFVPRSIIGRNISETISGAGGYNKPENTRVVKDLLIKSKLFDEPTAEDISQRAVELEADIAQIFDIGSKTDMTMYSPNSDIIYGVDFSGILTSLGYDKDYRYIVCVDEYLALLDNELITEENIENLKAYFIACVVCQIVDMADNTSEVNEHFYSVANNYMKDVMVSAYLDRNITDEDIDNINKIADKVIDVYKTRVNDITYLSDNAKDKALRKLENITKIIATPKSLISYKNAEVSSSNSYVTNCENCLLNKRREQNKFLSTEYTKDKVLFDTLDINAFYNPGSNTIIILAGILQEPYYSREKSFEENLGAIGTIVAHEISHSLDIVGSEYDENGNYKSWWSAEDRNAFIDNTVKLRKFMEAQGKKDGLTLNGVQTKNEDVADLTAIQCCVEVLNNMDNPDYEMFFTDYAKLWREKYSDEIQKTRIDYDTHSLAKYRVNTPLQQIEEFYTTFNVKEGDGMYVPESERISVW